jgi:transposase InsO family protein
MDKEILVDHGGENDLAATSKGESVLEMRLHVLCEQAREVLSYDFQAVPADKHGEFKKLAYVNENGDTVEWIPDTSVIWSHREPWVIEVKTLKELRDNFDKLSNKFEQAEERAEENGWTFHVFTDAHLADSFRVDNLIDLESQLGYQTEECVAAVNDCFFEKDEWTVAELQEQLASFPRGTVLSSVYHLVYNQELYIDMNRELTVNTPVTSDSSLHVSLDDWLTRYDWRKELEGLLASETVAVVDDRQMTARQRDGFEKRKAIVLDMVKGLKQADIARVHGVTVRWVQKLWKRSAHGKNMDALVEKPRIGRPKQSLFDPVSGGKPRFLDPEFEQVVHFYERSERPGLESCWRYFKTLKRGKAWDSGWIDSDSTPYRELKRLYSINGLQLPSRDVFIRELKRYASEYRKRVLVKREGFKAGSKATRNITGSTPMMNYAGQVCQIDHTLADIIPAVPAVIHHEQEAIANGIKERAHYMERPVITVVIDLHTRVILGYAFRYRRPSKETTFMALRRTVLGKVNPLLTLKEQQEMSTGNKIVRGFRSMASSGLVTEATLSKIERAFSPDHGRPSLRDVADWWDNLRVMPRLLHADNGSDLTSVGVENWTRRYRIKLAFRPVGGANYGGHVERVLRTLNEKGFNVMPGTTKGSTAKRKDYTSEKKATLTFEQLEAIFLLVIIQYHVETHSALGMPPSEAWKRAVDEGHNLLPFDLADRGAIKEFAYNTLPVRKASYIMNEGIKINKIRYNHDDVSREDRSWSERYSKGDKITVRYDTSDVRFVWWWNPAMPPRGKPVRVWAAKIRLGSREYGKNELKRFPPVSLFQVKDFEAANVPDRTDADLFERLVNGADNIYFGMLKELPLLDRKRKKALQARARELELERIALKELEETTGLLTGTVEEKVKALPPAEKGMEPLEEEDDDDDFYDDEEPVTPYETDIEKIRAEIVGRYSYYDEDEDEDDDDY